MKKIPLTQGKFALVDDEDYQRMRSIKWSAVKARNTYYAVSCYRIRDKIFTQRMHRLVTEVPKGMNIDHIDRNGLNNQKSNLRTCNPPKNLWNRTKSLYKGKRPTSKYKGLTWTNGAWVVNISANNVKHYLGRYYREASAAREYDKLAKLLHGEFACLNFPDK
jgi:hypothetical protein